MNITSQVIVDGKRGTFWNGSRIIYLQAADTDIWKKATSHAYRNPGDIPMNKVEEFLDSVDVPGGPLTALWAPVGLRFHATHHLFPSMPYHELGKCYKAMITELPNPELYLSSTRKTLAHAIVALWKDAKAAKAGNPVLPAE